ncbi:MAG: regulatory protein TetR [Marmoricola sp.]|nr:regulatory protein TetR [Marmoricola sp.]
MASSTTKPSARERLLESANELFYREGVQSVGIDRVIEHAGVAKASLYNTFGSKEELVHAYLLGRQATTTARITAAIEARSTPRAQLLAVFDSQAESQRRPGFRGCAFAAASAESKPGGLVEQATQGYRTWLRELFVDLATLAGAHDPALLGRQLQLLYDGAASAGNLDHDPAAALSARAAAEALLDLSTGSDR